MAKIKITGNASGTGVLTVTAPNTSTDRTITLPDSTGTLAVNSDVTNKLPLAGGTMTGHLLLNDSVNIKMGAGADFKLSHDGNNSYIEDAGTGALRILSSQTEFKNTADSTIFTRIDSDGIKFGSDTAAANALDDYETGTWTPNLSVKPSGVALSTVTAATYTKIGDRVFISLQCLITSSSVPAANSDMRIIGFPFTNANSGVNMPATFNYNYKQTPQLHINGSGYLYYQDTTVGGNNQSPAGSGLDASNTLSLAIQYKTNS